MIYDVAFLGAGPGGYVGAIRGGQLGAKICVIEEKKLGGTCLNVGCIPSKAFYASASKMLALHGAKEFGVNAKLESFDLAACVARKDKVVSDLVGGVKKLLTGNGVDIVHGRGRLENPETIRVTTADGGSFQIQARNIILSTGSKPIEIPVMKVDGDKIVNSDQIWGLKDLPARMAIIGGGVVGCELAHIFSAFGSKVTVIEMLDRLLVTEDKEAARLVQKTLKARDVDVKTGVRVEKAEVAGKEVKVTLATGEELTFDRVVVSIGRVPRSRNIGLEDAGLELDEKGFVAVNDEMETEIPGIYAVGDVVGKYMLAHVATSEAMVAVHNALGKKYWMDYSTVPRATFTSPEVASVGTTEEELKKSGAEYRVGRFAYAASGKAVCMGEKEGFIKIISDDDTGRIVGATIAGHSAAEIIGEVAVAMRMEASPGDIVTTIHTHPTISEVILEASEDTMGLSIHKMVRRSRPEEE
jgi:dihydrolipoamide dehydrogenase